MLSPHHPDHFDRRFGFTGSQKNSPLPNHNSQSVMFQNSIYPFPLESNVNLKSTNLYLDLLLLNLHHVCSTGPTVDLFEKRLDAVL